MEYISDRYKLSSGKEFYANHGIIGIAPDLEISEGYDGGLSWQFTKEDKREIAEYMIKLWERFLHEEN